MIRVFLDGNLLHENQCRLLLNSVEFNSYTAVENIPVRSGVAVYLSEHGKRLRASMKGMSMKRMPWSFEACCRDVVKKNRMRHGNLQVRLWADFGSGEVTHLMIRPWLRKRSTLRPAPLKLMTATTRHYGPGSVQGRLKAGAMLNNLQAAWEIQAWADDGLRLTPAGMVAEGVWTNIVIEKDGELRTPPLHEGILAGVTRNPMLAKARKAKKRVRDVSLTRYDLYTADKVWLCSSLHGPVAVSTVDGREIG